MDKVIRAIVLMAFVFAVVAGTTLAAVLLMAKVLSVLWVWFLVPLGVPAVSVAHIVGILAIKSFFVGDPGKHVASVLADYETLTGKYIAFCVFFAVRVLVPLGVGWIALGYM